MLLSRNGNPWWVWYSDDAIPSEVQISVKTQQVLIGQGMGGFANKQIVSIDELLNNQELQSLIRERHGEETQREIIKYCETCTNEKRSGATTKLHKT